MGTQQGTEPVDTPEPTEANKPTVEGAKPDEQLGDAGKAALAAERKRAAAAEKQNKELADRLKELEDKDKSEVEKLREETAKAQAEIAEFKQREQIDLWKKEVIETAELPAEVAAVLKGSTLEELTAHAAALKALIPADGKKPATGPYVPPAPSKPGDADAPSPGAGTLRMAYAQTERK